jgi:hypothetical protein
VEYVGHVEARTSQGQILGDPSAGEFVSLIHIGEYEMYPVYQITNTETIGPDVVDVSDEFIGWVAATEESWRAVQAELEELINEHHRN